MSLPQLRNRLSRGKAQQQFAPARSGFSAASQETLPPGAPPQAKALSSLASEETLPPGAPPQGKAFFSGMSQEALLPPPQLQDPLRSPVETGSLGPRLSKIRSFAITDIGNGCQNP